MKATEKPKVSWRVPTVCQVCGITFIPKQAFPVACSRSCYSTYRRANNPVPGKKPRKTVGVPSNTGVYTPMAL